MLIDRVDTFLDALEESQLLTAAQLEECRRAHASFPDTKALAKHLLQRDWLTAYQVNHVLQAKGGELVLGPYVLLERIGQGGMGQVFKARHRLMNRVVALKVIRQERLGNPELVKRFRREIRLAAHLSHPNIVIAHDAQQVGNTHFLVTEYVEGTDLARLVEKDGKRPVAQACDCVRQAALGLQHAHERGLVHRDIKPANLLLAVRENVVKVLDMGLARLSQAGDSELAGAGLTQEGTVMGTPDYMAPEQAEDTTTVDTRADVYSLGCTLYFLLTGGVPFPGGTLAQKLRKHAQAEPAPLDAARPEVPAGLAAVVRKMMAKRPEDRYQVPGEVAAALGPFCRTGPVPAIPVAQPASRPVAVPLSEETLAALPRPVGVPAAVAVPAGAPPQAGGETVPPSVLDSVPSVTVRAPGPAARLREQWRRLGPRGQVAAGAVAGLLLLLAVAVALWPRKKDEDNRPVPPPQGLFKLDPRKVPKEERRPWHPKEFNDMLVAVLGDHRARMPGLSCFALRPDGKKLALGGPGLLRADAETLRPDNDDKALTGHNGPVNCLTFSADGRLLVTGGADKTVRLWDGATGQSRGTLKGIHDGPISAVAITRDGRRVLSGGEDKVVRVWDVTTREQLAAYQGHITPVRALAVSPDGQYAFSVGDTSATGQTADRDVHMWELNAVPEKPERRFKGHEGMIAQLAVAPDGKRLLAAGSKPSAWLWDLTDPEHPLALPADSNPNVAAGAAFLPDGRVVTTGTSNTGGVKVWKKQDDLKKTPVEAFTSPRALATNTPLACYPDNRRVAFVEGSTVRVWDVETKEEWRPPLGHHGAVTHLALGGGRWLLSAGRDNRLRLWDLETGQQQGTAFSEVAGNESFTGIALSPDSHSAFTTTGTGSVRLWETSTPYRNLRSFVVEPKSTDLGPVAVSPDGKRLLAADKQLALWDTTSAATDLPLRRPDGHASSVRQLGFLIDDAHPRRAYSFDGTELRVWDDVEKGNEVRKLPVVGNVVAVSRDADPICAGQGGGVMLWHDLGDPRSRPQPSENRHAGQAATAMALSPDNGTLFTAGGEHVVWWDVAPDRIKFRQEWDIAGGVNALLFAPDGRHLVMANGNTTIYVLRLPEK